MCPCLSGALERFNLATRVAGGQSGSGGALRAAAQITPRREHGRNWPTALSARLKDEDVETLFAATKSVLSEWTDRLRRQLDGAFPEKVTAFHDEMVVHGKYGKPCLVCGSPVQRIRYADNETNYCARCQTGGRLLADRALSRLLKEDWPRSIDEVE